MSDDHKTPDWIKMMFEEWFDPCPLNPTFDGLKIPWQDRTFANVPYSRKKKDKAGVIDWVKKAIDESRQGKRIALLVRHDHTTDWFAQLYLAGAHFLPIMERVKFTGNGSPPFLSTLVILEASKA